MVDRVVTPPVIVGKAMLENSAKNQCAKNLVKMEAGVSVPIGVLVFMDIRDVIVKLITEQGHVLGTVHKWRYQFFATFWLSKYIPIFSLIFAPHPTQFCFVSGFYADTTEERPAMVKNGTK